MKALFAIMFTALLCSFAYSHCGSCGEENKDPGHGHSEEQAYKHADKAADETATSTSEPAIEIDDQDTE
jgi:hypothetical protein